MLGRYWLKLIGSSLRKPTLVCFVYRETTLHFWHVSIMRSQYARGNDIKWIERHFSFQLD